MSRIERQRTRLKMAARKPGPWREITVTAEMRAEAPHLKHLARRFYNGRLQADCFQCPSSVGGVVHLIVMRLGLLEAPTVEDLQSAKGIFGHELTAVEIFPPTQMNDKVRHLWLMPVGYELPFGFTMEFPFGGA